MAFNNFPFTDLNNVNIEWFLNAIRTLQKKVKELEDNGGTGGVESVNGQTGVVVITAAGLGAYVKPPSGIPKTDLASGIQTSLNKADSAYQKPSSGIPETDLASAIRRLLLPNYDQNDNNYFLRINYDGNPVFDDYDTTIKAYINGQIATAISGVDEIIGTGVIT